MTDRAPYDNLEGQLDMWRDCKPQPDRNGLFDAGGVVWIASRRHCTVTVQSDLVLTVTAKATVQLVAMAPGRWDPVAILAACTKAQGRQVLEIDVETAHIENHGGLDERKIARIVGSDGMRPYLVRDGRYYSIYFEDAHSPARLRSQTSQAGLARRGMKTWLFAQRAYLPPTLNLYENDAINEIAAGRV